ncbi:MAG: hypothetical protein Q9165_005479 [Trypethelium subeluteriae]
METSLHPEGQTPITDSAGNVTHGSSSPASSGYLTPPIDTPETPRRKHVAWERLAAPSTSRANVSSNANPTSQEAPPQRSRRKLSNQEIEDDLRKSVIEYFRREAGPSRKKRPREATARSQETLALKRKPKSALRSGTTTPPSSRSPQVLPAHDETPEEEEGKARSAIQARNKANELQEHLGDGTEAELNTSDQQDDRHRWSRGSFSNLYHDRDDDLLESGQMTPSFGDDHVPRPARFRLGGLSTHNILNKLANLSAPSSRAGSRAGSRTGSPERPTSEGDGASKSKLSSLPRTFSEQDIAQTLNKISQRLINPKKKRHSHEADLRIKKHVQETLMRQRYILLLCRCLMVYGAPTHRLEDYLKTTSRILEIEAQFLYLPGCMIVSFDDSKMHTAEVKLVKANERVDLGKLRDTHIIYKMVVHDEIGVEEAMKQLDQIREKPKKFKLWFLILLHGVASATVAPWAYQGRAIDLPIAFFLGCLVGFLRFFWAAKSDLYSAVFEIAAVAITSFLSRAFGSINGGRLFCFSTLASSSITLILPGYTILCAALELQSRSIVAGSVRMVFALVYSLFIGFSLTIGTAIYGIIDKNATSSPQCENPMPAHWAFFFVPVFTFCLMVINQAKWRQMPLMLIIAFAGYIVSFFSARAFSEVSAVSSGLAAIAISVMANIYNRLATRLDTCVSSVNASFTRTFLRRGNPQVCESVAEPDLEKEAGSARGDEVAWSTRGVEGEPHNDDSGSLFHEKEVDLPEGNCASTPEILPVFGGTDEAPSNSSLHWGPSQTDAHPKKKITGESKNSSANRDERVSWGPSRIDDAQNNKSSDLNKEQSKPRVSYSLAASAMLPAIFVLVPSGLSVQGSLVQGISTADQITNLTSASGNNGTNGTGIVTSSQLSNGANDLQNSLAFSVGYSVIQIAIGITVGLFIGALVVYPFGKGGKWGGTKNMRSGLFSF